MGPGVGSPQPGRFVFLFLTTARLAVQEAEDGGLERLRAGHELDQAQLRTQGHHLIRAHLRACAALLSHTEG